MCTSTTNEDKEFGFKVKMKIIEINSYNGRSY